MNEPGAHGRIVKIYTTTGTQYIGVLDKYLPEKQAVQLKRCGVIKGFHKWFEETWIAEGIINNITDPTPAERVDYLKNGRDVHKTLGIIN